MATQPTPNQQNGGWSPQTVIYAILATITVLGTVLWQVSYTFLDQKPNRLAENLAEIARQQNESHDRAQVEIAKLNAQNRVPQQATVVRDTEEVSTFSCPTPAETERGFARNDVFDLAKPETTYRIHSGCVWIRPLVQVTSVTAERYQLQRPNGRLSESGEPQFDQCGTIQGDDQDCKRFLNRYRGSQIRAVVQNGGHLTIN